MGRYIGLYILLLAEILQAQPYPQDYFQSPLEIPLVLSGTFGELRSNHFHSGIDIKTQQRTGLPVKAAASGTVARIKVSANGYGKALYIKHPNGYTTVYAHLEAFNDEIQKYVIENQYRLKKYEIELFPPAGLLSFEAGEVVALSGNSGGSGAPHLHFEIRDTRTEEIINPLLFGISVPDSKTPDLYDLEVYEFEAEELISTQSLDLINLGGGKYAIAGDEVITVNHEPAFGLRTTDRLNGANNRNGVYGIKLEVGQHVYYQFAMERFAFAESRYINSHIDFGQKKCCLKTINRLYLEPNNRFSAYENTATMNFPLLNPDSIYDVLITVNDVAGNVSTLNFKLKSSADTIADFEEGESELPFSVFRFDQTNFFKKENIEFALPEGALYRNMHFFYGRQEPCTDCYSFIHVLSSEEIPVHKYYKLKIKPDVSFEGDPKQLAIMSMKNGKPVDFEGGEWDGKYVTTRTRQFGEFAIMADQFAPAAITGNFVDGGTVKSSSGLKLIVKDDMSGIDFYQVMIDGKWELFEYDAKNNALIHDFKVSALEPGEHVLDLVLRDKLGNESKYNYHFILR